VSLPPQLHVFVRDWLSANHVVLRSADGNVVVDTGYGDHVPLTLALIASRAGLDGEPLDLVVNTHAHSDHIGGNAALKRAYGCRIAMPERDAADVARWDTRALLLDYAGQAAERFTVDEPLRAGTQRRWGDHDWELLAAPGHAMGALVFYNALHGILVSGDALWHDGFGFVMPRAMDPEALPATRATLDLLATLDVRTVIPGHGEPFADFREALARARSRLAAFEADEARQARHAVRVVLAFNLLHRKRMPLADLPAYLERTALFAEMNERYLRQDAGALAQWLCRSLCDAGVARVSEEALVPAGPGSGRSGSQPKILGGGAPPRGQARGPKK
jgi:glyoxylase-like metal-dependent hydrolase (beta-lactamase superfamily II)